MSTIKYEFGRVNTSIDKVVEHILGSHTLTSLHLRTKYYCNDAELDLLVNSIASKADILEQLTFVSFHFTKRHRRQLFGEIPFRYLAKLELHDISIEPIFVAMALRNTLMLTRLDLTNNGITAGGAQTISDALTRHNIRLSALLLSYNKTKASFLTNLLPTIPNFFCLSTLHIQAVKMQLGNRGMRMISEFVQRNSSLTSLALTWEQSTNIEEIRYFFQTIRINIILEYLNFTGPVPEQYLSECFEDNKTIVRSDTFSIYHYTKLNHVCQWLNATPLERRSVPREYILAAGRDKIIKYLEEIRRDGKEWKKMKIVVLGNKGIGKTSLVEALKRTHQGRPLEWFEEENDDAERECGEQTMEIGGATVTIWDFAEALRCVVPHSFFSLHEMSIVLVCFDLDDPMKCATDQIVYWMDLLQSCLPPYSSSPTFKWKVIAVGLRNGHSTSLPPPSPATTSEWQQTWFSLPLHPETLLVSTLDEKTIQRLLEVIKDSCTRILSRYSRLIPRSCKAFLESLPHNQFSLSPALYTLPTAMGSLSSEVCLNHLHALGIIWMNAQLLCACTYCGLKEISQFLSPEVVKARARSSRVPYLLIQSDITDVLGRPARFATFDRTVHMLNHFGVCFVVRPDERSDISYIFPSLAPESGAIEFSPRQPSLEYRYLGITFTIATPNQVILPRLLWQSIHTLISLLRITLNGVLLRINPQVLDGEILVQLSADSRSITVITRASNLPPTPPSYLSRPSPTSALPTSRSPASPFPSMPSCLIPNGCTSFSQFISKQFSTAFAHHGCKEVHLCPTCIRQHCIGVVNKDIQGLQYCSPFLRCVVDYKKESL